MGVFIRNLDPSSTAEKVEEWIAPILESIDIHVFDIRKRTGTTYANLTVTDVTKAHKLIEKSRTITTLPRHPRTGQSAEFKVDRKPPDTFLLKALDREERDKTARKQLPKFKNNHKTRSNANKQHIQKLEVKSIDCGRWETKGGRRILMSYYHLEAAGSLVKKARALILRGESVSPSSCFNVVFDYMNIESIVIPTTAEPDFITINLVLAPKFYELPMTRSNHTAISDNDAAPSDFSALIQNLSQLLHDPEPRMTRTSALPGADILISGTCLTYRINLSTRVHRENLRTSVESLTSKQVSVWSDDAVMAAPLGNSLALQEKKRLEKLITDNGLSFAARFQLEALWANASLSPSEIRSLLPLMLKLTTENTNSDKQLVALVRSLQVQVPPAGPGIDPSDSGCEKAYRMLNQNLHAIRVSDENTSDEVAIHRVTVTPAGTYLYGPEREAPNRVLRQFAGHEKCFLRVTFADESGDKIFYDSEASNDRILNGRFLGILRNGFYVAGEHFDFLGFSHSSLRSQTCWFMRPFVNKGLLLNARSVISSLGDFSHIRCAAKCAARIGQAFSDTQKAMTVDPSNVCTVADIERNSCLFTDGCGTMSKLLWANLKSMSWGAQPTLYQIRYKGAKGMLSLDTGLKGHQMCLRPSMIKFDRSPSNDLEICGTNGRPLPFRLNRQLIKILEDLGVKHEAFKVVMDQAVEKLRTSAHSRSSAVDFFCSNLSSDPTGIAQLLTQLTEIGVDVVEDQFIRIVIRALIEVQLRALKFKTQIPISRAVTLYGICDETDFLREGQVYVTFETESSQHDFIEGPVAVTRCPALHPGDIQVAEAVAAPPDSRLRDLTNCVVFSQKGERDMASKLAGGDLDGDLFGVIFDKTLLPKVVADAAEYPRIPSIDLGRAVTSEDIATFFIDFMKTDQLGRIATLHQVYADRDEQGTFSQDCLTLATLHSAAVDFSKTGQAVNMRQIPKTPNSRPDFMAPSASTRVYRGINEAEDASSNEPDDPHRYRYYESSRSLGKLYRSINEDEFFESLQDDETSIFGGEGTDDVMDQVWDLVIHADCAGDWKAYLDMAQQVKEYYNTMMTDIMSQYAVWGTKSLTEQEVLIGTIIERSGAGSHRQREQSELMRAKYKGEVQDIRQWMKSNTDDDRDAYSSLAIACLSLCVGPKDGRTLGFGDELRSFAWFAAAICVPRLIARES